MDSRNKPKVAPGSQVYIGPEPPRPGTAQEIPSGKLNLEDNPHIIERDMVRLSGHPCPGTPDKGSKGYVTVKSDLRPGKPPSGSD